MKKPFAAAAVFAALALCAGGRVRVTDATGRDVGAVGRFALPWAAEKRLELSVRKLEAGAALEKLAAGETDIVLLKSEDLPTGFSGKHRVYAHRALIVAVNAQNPVRSVTRRQLKLLLTGTRPTWAEVGGDDVDIHRYCVGTGNGGILGEKELHLFSAAPEILKLGSFGEALLLAEADPAALALGPYQPELPERVAALGIDGVSPSLANIRSGAYPLRETYCAVLGTTAPPAAAELFQMLGSKEFYEALEADGAIPPAAVPGN